MSDPNASHPLRLLEERHAHLERQYDELNAVVIEQQRHLQRLQKQLDRLGESINAQELERIRATQSRPPHYQ